MFQLSKLGQFFIKSKFDKDGNLLGWSGLPILMDYKIPEDPEMLRILDKYRPKLDSFVRDIAGYTKVELSNECAHGECNLGNLIADGLVHYYVRTNEYKGPGWTDAAIALINSGGIRQPIEIGNVSRFHLSTVLPFENGLLVVNVPGHILKEALERAVELYEEADNIKPFLQMSGMRVVYDLHKNVGNRVQSVDVLCSNCYIPIYEKLNMGQTYGIIIDRFLHAGGDGYTMFQVSLCRNCLNWKNYASKMANGHHLIIIIIFLLQQYAPQAMNVTSFDTTYDYIKHLELVYTPIDGRITFSNRSGASLATSIIPVPMMIALFTSLFAFKSAFI